ncbi:hypothetical protein MLD38_002430 [Melastoma candidum]|uniref:Uncharacterized protein n=1 Tax=Melastoma candidum TaxID=119954 RepID=A0ACB9RZ18_9MYRT|nr:hypothetical protein MLD38_002430 [Melastoma candidum]
MAAEDAKILGTWSSPFVMRTMIALNLKGVEYQMIEETASPKSELLLKVNPVYKKIPVLIHANRPVCESLITVQYIDEAWSSGPTILPSDPYERAMARFWGAYIDDEWFPAFHGVSKMKGEEARKASLERVLEGVQLLEGAYLNFSKGKPFFGGDRIGYLDIAFGCFLGWIRFKENKYGIKILGEDKVPGLAKWAERFCLETAVKDLMPDAEKLAGFSKVLAARYKAIAAAATAQT